MLDKGAIAPTRAHSIDAGLDIYTPIRVKIFPGERAAIDTGVHIDIPAGYVGFLKSKSGLNVKHGIRTEGGVIDAGYTGSIVASICNGGDEPHTFEAGDKITQLVILPIETPEVEIIDCMPNTERGDDGFGSTGI